MRIEELSVRTMKEDNAKRIQDEETLLIRGGFVRRVEGRLYHTELGMRVLKNIRRQVEEVLQGHGFRDLGMEGSLDLREVRDSLHDYLKSGVSSYRDLPLGLAYWGQVRYDRQAKESLWQRSHEETVVLAVLAGEGPSRLGDALKAVMETFGLEDTVGRQEIFFVSEGKKDAPDRRHGERRPERETAPSVQEVGSLVSVPTSHVRTIRELAAFFSCPQEKILKTILFSHGEEDYAVVLPGNHEVDVEKVKTFLDITGDAFQAMEEASIRRVTSAEPGYAGPVGLKGVKVLVDQSVRQGVGYHAGANLTDHHLSNVVYLRDFTGEKGDFARVDEGRPGYVLGRLKTMKEAVRYRTENDSLAAAKPEWGYLNLSRLMLAVCRANLDGIGIDLPRGLAPFEAAVIPLDTRDEDLIIRAESLYDGLSRLGIRVLLDARSARLGAKLKDCDLLSIRRRVLVGRRQDEARFELKDRNGDVAVVNLAELVEILRS